MNWIDFALSRSLKKRAEAGEDNPEAAAQNVDENSQQV